MDAMKESYEALTASFAQNPRARDASKQLLLKFKANLDSAYDELAHAVNDDFNKPELEFYVAEFGAALGEISNLINNLDRYLKPESPLSSPISFSTLSVSVDKIALGTVLIISPFNYPLILAVSPLAGAIAAGNNVVIKLPFDQLPSFCTALTRVIEATFHSDQVLVVNGGIDESQYLLNQCKFDKIFFTGSTNVGKIVYKAAAEKLTPVVLELGGKSPVFISKNIDMSSLESLMDRLLWGKFTNAGQTCVAPDYLMIESTVYDEVLKKLLQVFTSKFTNINDSSDFSHIVNQRGFDRLSKLLEETKGTIFTSDKEKNTNFIPPTLVTNVEWNDALMQSEIFGPILPIMKYTGSLMYAVKEAAKYHDTPLAAYLFSSAEEDLVTLKSSLRSGAILVNETLMSAGCFVSPFGGIGTSGFGNYHSKWSINTFTHERAVLKQPMWAETLIKARYFPYSSENLRLLKSLSSIPEIPYDTIKSSSSYAIMLIIGIFIGRYLF